MKKLAIILPIVVVAALTVLITYAILDVLERMDDGMWHE